MTTEQKQTLENVLSSVAGCTVPFYFQPSNQFSSGEIDFDTIIDGDEDMCIPECEDYEIIDVDNDDIAEILGTMYDNMIGITRGDISKIVRLDYADGTTTYIGIY